MREEEEEEASVDILVDPCEGAIKNHLIMSCITANFLSELRCRKLHFLLVSTKYCDKKLLSVSK